MSCLYQGIYRLELMSWRQEIGSDPLSFFSPRRALFIIYTAIINNYLATFELVHCRYLSVITWHHRPLLEVSTPRY